MIPLSWALEAHNGIPFTLNQDLASETGGSRGGVKPMPAAAAGPGLGERMSVSGIKLVFRIASLLVNIAVALALVSVILFFLLPRLLNWDLQVVLSGSMEPALPVGSAILVRPVDPQAVSVGDIITYRQQTSPDFVTHRVVEINREGSALSFHTKGDANEDPDALLVPAEAVEGRVWVNIAYLGYVAQHMRQPWGFLLLVGVPGTIIIAGEVRNIVRDVRQERRKRLAARQQGDGA
jgi:signal peptidase